MSLTIPASQIVDVIPSVISAGGSALSLNGMILTPSTRVPTGSALSFPTAQAVSDFFGSGSAEAVNAAIYFAGFQGSNILPSAMWFAQYNAAGVAAWLRGGDISGLTLAQLQALAGGTVIVTVNGTQYTSSSINLASAGSFSAAAALIQAAFTTPPFSVTYDSVSGAFVFTSTTTGTGSTITFATGTMAASLLLQAAQGATISQGAAAVTDVAGFMDNLVGQTTNWASFMFITDPDSSGNSKKLAFATWNGQQNNRYVYVCTDTDITPTQSTNAAASLGQLLNASETSGTILIYEPGDLNIEAFICGAIASIDFTQTNGRATLAFKSQSGMPVSVTDPTVAANLIANGYNYYGAYATANDQFSFFYPGSVSGVFKWADSYVNQIWLNNALQLALMELLTNVKSIPYNNSGYSLIRAACMDPIDAGANFGAFVGGVQLSNAQAAEVNNAAGVAIDRVLSSAGWYLQVKDAPAQTRANRLSPPMTFWYMDGGSVQKINLASVEVQ